MKLRSIVFARTTFNCIVLNLIATVADSITSHFADKVKTFHKLEEIDIKDAQQQQKNSEQINKNIMKVVEIKQNILVRIKEGLRFACYDKNYIQIYQEIEKINKKFDAAINILYPIKLCYRPLSEYRDRIVKTINYMVEIYNIGQKKGQDKYIYLVDLIGFRYTLWGLKLFDCVSRPASKKAKDAIDESFKMLIKSNFENEQQGSESLERSKKANKQILWQNKIVELHVLTNAMDSMCDLIR